MKSAIALSMHKAGSSIADRILVDFFRANGMKIDRIADLVPKSELTEAEIFINHQEKMEREGHYYGIARGPYVSDMPIVDELRAIIQIRDPRDCLTSAYFSFRESHKPPKDPTKRAAFLKRREQLQDMTIDQYVIRNAGNYAKRMNILKDIVSRHPDALVLTYEEMVRETDNWLGRISKFLDQPLTDDLMRTLGDKIDFTVATEDITRHKRQVSPGDHTRKFAPATITQISKQLEPQLAYFGYPV